MLCGLDTVSYGSLWANFRWDSLSFGVMREKTSEGESNRVVYCIVLCHPWDHADAKWANLIPVRVCGCDVLCCIQRRLALECNGVEITCTRRCKPCDSAWLTSEGELRFVPQDPERRRQLGRQSGKHGRMHTRDVRSGCDRSWCDRA